MDNAKELKKQLFMEVKNSGEVLSEGEMKKAFDYCEGYKEFLGLCKTERAAAMYAIGMLEKHGYKPYDKNRQLVPGDKIYVNNRGKALIAAVIGTAPPSEGMNITAAHIDSPRLDLKPRPLYEDNQIALFKTHYYGGIKKYQWTAIPLSLQGGIVRKDGTQIDVNIGESVDDPVFTVTDLLPHLADEQNKRELKNGIKGEELNILTGSLPYPDKKEGEKVKLNVMNLLHEKYGITEHDFTTAELEAVPAIKVSDVGIDRSMVGGYGQDDRVCSYAALTALCQTNRPIKTCVMVLADKEEIGSDGNTGLRSDFMRSFLADIAESFGVNPSDAIAASKCLSADVNAAFDPTFSDVFEKNNTAYLGRGVVVTKYTGSRGKSGSSDASAEYAAYVRKIFDDNDILWQTGELGKVDMGGGGTVAAYIANLGMDVIDVGVPVLSMHSPFEVTSKPDIYMTHLALAAFYCVFT
ncbi:MAG: aminopeptidase [Oscillospiraceae bacterium]|nr:aminopeptidase [Oscillospiraceae bacterium]